MPFAPRVHAADKPTSLCRAFLSLPNRFGDLFCGGKLGIVFAKLIRVYLKAIYFRFCEPLDQVCNMVADSVAVVGGWRGRAARSASTAARRFWASAILPRSANYLGESTTALHSFRADLV